MSGRQEYNEIFDRELARLNPSQRLAVERIEGPVLVIAGPGTGKTQILAARIGQILRQTDAQANNILCLTFTDAGVQAMRKRLVSLIGPDAYRIPIFTFHAFCHAVVQDNLSLFGRRELEPLSELERVEVIRRMLDELDPHHPLRQGQADPYLYESQLADLFQRMKAENWTVEYVHQQIADFLLELPGRPEYTYRINRGDKRVGDPKTAQIEQAHERMARLRAASALLPAYEARLKEWGRYDYNDMISWVLTAFQEHELLLRTYQEQYLYILSDEYQDTNGAQNDILKLLASYWDSPNLFIVGDDDQSVYEFQGARLRNMIDFYERYAHDLCTVVLTDNYRSSQPILDAARHLIDFNARRLTTQLKDLGIEKILTARHPAMAQIKLPPIIAEYPNRFQEEAALLLLLEERHQQGVAWSEMAILFAQHRQVSRLQRLLEQRGIPYQTKRRINALDSTIVRQLRDILTYIDLEARQPYSGEHLLFRILHFRCLGLLPADLAKMSLAYASQPPAERHAWRTWLDQTQHWPSSLQNGAAITRVAHWLEEMIGDLHELPLPQVVERVINRSGLLLQATSAPDRIWQVQLLKTVLDFVREEAARHPRLSLTYWLDSLGRMDDNRLILPMQQEREMAEAVQLVTAHSAKGLEFGSVFLLDATSDYWDPANGKRAQRFPLPDTLTCSGEEDALEARRRLFFVAMTRAKDYLHISYARATEQNKPLQKSRFVEELLSDGAALQVTEKSLSEVQLWEQQIIQLQEPPPPMMPALERELVARLLDGFQLSISAFNRFLRCPLTFFYEVVLQAPQAQSEAATYGIAMHHALQWCFDSMTQSPDRAFPGAAELNYRFEQEMDRLRAFFSPHSYQQRLAEGRRNLPAYYRQHLSNWPRRVRTELRVRHVEVDGVPIHGVIDRLDMLEGNQARVLDYKTGSQADYKLARPTEARPEGGSYWRQLVFYKLLVEGNRPASGLQLVAGTISYLDPDRQGRYPERSLTYEPLDTQRLKAMLKNTYERIQAQDFYTGCGKPDCLWCQFVRQGQETNSFSDEAIEALDDDY